MASIRRTDIMQKKYPKIRPGKSERERLYKRHEAFRWRDTRRVFLAGSFDRWRKLRSALKLKDSSLAWHLMEAHEKGHCTLCRQYTFQSSKEGEPKRSKCDQNEFLPSLIASLRQLCHAHFDFDECIEIVGLLCLEFDKARKENFSLNELIKLGSKPGLPCYFSRCVQEQLDCPVQQTSSSPSQSNALLQKLAYLEKSEHEPQPASASIASELLATNKSLSQQQKQKLMTSEQESLNPLGTTCNMPDVPHQNLTSNPSSLSPVVADSVHDISSEVKNSSSSSKLSVEACSLSDTTKGPQRLEEEHALMDSSLCSESEPSLEIDIEKMDTSQEEDVSIQESQENQDHTLLSEFKFVTGLENLPERVPHIVSNVSENLKTLKGSQCNSESVPSLPKSEPVSTDQDNTSNIHEAKSESTEMPLDMSVLKASVKQELDIITSDSAHDDGGDSWSPNHKLSEGELIETVKFSSSSGKRKISEGNITSPQCSRRSPFWLEGFPSWPGKTKEEGHTSIPWQRRDMSRKEEYEYLEMNPFSDLAEFSQRYPHVHQRTYYRWKRRIKEEYIILEQCPSMSFHEFSSIVLQAKESVFCHWKTLISQGKGFFAPADSSKRLEVKYPIKPGSPHNSAYAFMQKNLAFTYEQFCQQYPGTPVGAFNVLKRKAMQEFWLFHQNQHMSHKDFSKLVNISEDVFNTWKECVESFRSHTLSQNLKTVSNSVSPNSQKSHPSFQSVDSPSSSATDVQSPSLNGSLFKMKNNGAPFKDSVASPQHTDTLNDTVVRNMSANYFASLQNMLFPWHSYYGMTSHIGQQMLPMMMWPGMMGLSGSMTNSLGLLSGSHVDAAPRSSNAAGFYPSMLGPVSEKSEKSEELQVSHSDEQVHSNKRMTGAESQERYKNQLSSDGEKRLKMSNDKDDVDFSGSASRSRKQNKQEYIYYLKNPELCFKELESLFPSISLRTFYRWRKEMNAAVLLLEDNKDMTFHQFQMVFPDIPEDIFELWKERAGNVLTPDLEGQNPQSLAEDLKCSVQSPSCIDSKSAEQSRHLIVQRDGHFSHDPTIDSTQSDEENTDHLGDTSREEYLFVQKNPDVDFTTFSKLYPDSSKRSFHRWKQELKDAVNYLKTNPTVSFPAYKTTIDSTVSEDVFSMWKTLANSNYVFEDEISQDSISVEEEETQLSKHISRKCTSPEYRFLQLNPYIEFSEFTCTYSDVPKHKFDHWKEEIQQILTYIQSEPTVEFSDIAAVFPDVSEDIFIKWKGFTTVKAESFVDIKEFVDCKGINELTNIVADKSEVDENVKNQMTKALLYLMENPTVKYSQFKDLFDFVSVTTFDLWLSRIKTVILHIASNPSIDYTTFSANIKDVAQDIFSIWKNLDPQEIAALNLDYKEPARADLKAESTGSSSFHSIPSSREDLTTEAFEFCKKNPGVAYSTFQSTYPAVSEKVFCNWMFKIQKQLQFIRENPDLEFDDFAKMYPHSRQDIFDLWKSDVLNSQIEHFLQEPSHNTESDVNISEGNLAEDSKPHIFRDIPNSTEMTLDAAKNHKEDVLMKSFARDYVKENVAEMLDNEPKESSLSKLAKFTDANALSYSKKNFTRKLSSSFDHLLKNNNNKTQHLESVFSPSDVDNFLNVSSATVSTHNSHLKGIHTSGVDGVDMYPSNSLPASLHTSSLSALMAMSRSEESHIKGNPALSPQKEQSGHGIPPAGSGNPLWRRTSNGPAAFGCSGGVRDDDEAFSSQRQKKMSRAEYLFVKDNPDVDSQEFSRIFPGVSARTFYRWKKEIKAQLQLA